MLRTRWSGVTSGRGEELNVSAGTNEGRGDHERGDEVGHGAGESHGELANALVGGFLAFGIGVSEEAADGEQEDGAQLEIEVRRNDEARSFTDKDGCDAEKEEAESAQDSGAAAEAETDEGKGGEEDVHAHLHAHPSAQWDCPAAHRGIVEGEPSRGQGRFEVWHRSGMLNRDARDCREHYGEGRWRLRRVWRRVRRAIGCGRRFSMCLRRGLRGRGFWIFMRVRERWGLRRRAGERSRW